MVDEHIIQKYIIESANKAICISLLLLLNVKPAGSSYITGDIGMGSFKIGRARRNQNAIIFRFYRRVCRLLFGQLIL